MGVITIDKMFDGPWGIVENRRKEIEAGPYGIFDQVFEEEVANNFLPIQKVPRDLTMLHGRS